MTHFLRFTTICLIVLLTVSAAKADDLFTVSKIPVDVTAASASEAREQAMLEGQQRGLAMLLKRLLDTDDDAAIPQITPEQASSYVLSISIDRERASNVRYLAEMTVEYNENRVQQLVGDYAIRRAQQQADAAAAEVSTAEAEDSTASAEMAKPKGAVLVLPVYDDGSNTMLWEELNPWRQAWDAYLASSGRKAYTVPVGDVADIAAVNVEQALQGVQEPIKALMTIYQAPVADVVVARKQVKNGVQLILVERTRFDGQRRINTAPLIFPVEAGDVTATLRQAVKETVATVELPASPGRATAASQSVKTTTTTTTVKTTTIPPGGALPTSPYPAPAPSAAQWQSLAVQVPVGSLGDWSAKQQRLARVPLIKQTRMTSLRPGEVSASLTFQGSAAELQQAVAAYGMTLQQVGNTWVLR